MKETIQLAHGGGGRLSHELIRAEIIPRFGGEALPDAATLGISADRIVLSTDSFVVQPLFFPGGNIGDLAVHGTVNDIAVSGGRPRWLSLSMIIEEGFELEKLRIILDSIQRAAHDCGVNIVTGDTKVVRRGQADGMYLNTSGIGELMPGFELNAARVAPEDLILVSGPLAEHGVAVMTARSGINIADAPLSDSAPVHRLVQAVGEFAPAVKFMRDPTRGGLAAVLNELVEGRPFGIEIDEDRIPLAPGVRAVCEMLGLDALHIPSEGRLIAVCSPPCTAGILAKWQALPEGRQAALLGKVSAQAAMVVMQTVAGGKRIIDWPQGELLPRIC